MRRENYQRRFVETTDSVTKYLSKSIYGSLGSRDTKMSYEDTPSKYLVTAVVDGPKLWPSFLQSPLVAYKLLPTEAMAILRKNLKSQVFPEDLLDKEFVLGTPLLLRNEGQTPNRIQITRFNRTKRLIIKAEFAKPLLNPAVEG